MSITTSATTTAPTPIGTRKPHYDLEVIKEAMRHRWREALNRLGGFPFEFLDGRHHGCPICGQGKDCFRLIDEEAGAVYCNRCFSDNNGSGFDAIMKATGKSFSEVLADVAKFLGVQPTRNGQDHKGNGAAKAKKNPFESVQWSSEELARYDSVWIKEWCETKPPITPTATELFGARVCCWPRKNGSRCVAFTGTDLQGNKYALLLYRDDGQPFAAFGGLSERKTHLVGGSTESWLTPGVELLRAASVVHKCEGLPDAATLHSLGLPDGHVAITNACGAKSANPVKLDYSWAKGKGRRYRRRR